MKRHKLLRFFYNWTSQICDPIRAGRGLKGLLWFFRDYVAYKKMPYSEPIHILDLKPSLHDHKTIHDLDAHYFYVNAWAMRRIISNRPSKHTDIASQAVFVGLLSAVMPVEYIDYRILRTVIPGLKCKEGNIISLPYKSNSVESVSCLHVFEHIGLGRYGDSLDPKGPQKAACELKRILAPGGNLYFAVPVGRPRVCFNAHRIYTAQTIRDYFNDLDLVELSGVHDDGSFVERVMLDEFIDSDYACGMFWFTKSRSD